VATIRISYLSATPRATLAVFPQVLRDRSMGPF
jgi:hypothetical protein